MTAAECIAFLDEKLAQYGDTVILRRYLAPNGSPRPKTDLTVQAVVRPTKTTTELAGDADEVAWTAVISPTDFLPLWPIVKGDKLIVDGNELNIEVPMPVRIRGELVRCDLLVAG